MSYDVIILVLGAIMLGCAFFSALSLFAWEKRSLSFSLLGICVLCFLFLIFVDIDRPSFVTKLPIKNATIIANGYIGQRNCHIVVIDSVSYVVETSGDTLILKKTASYE